jgi:hypothetical protein
VAYVTFFDWRAELDAIDDAANKHGRAFGFVPSPPDPRDYQYRYFAAVTPLPSRVVYDMPPVRDQGQFGTCVGFASWAVKESQEKGKCPPLSPRFIYAMCKQLDGLGGAGTYPRVAMQVLQTYGTCPEEDFPYSELKDDMAPAPPLDYEKRLAEPWKIKVYAQVNGIQELKRALYEQGPLLVGLYITESFLDAKKTIPLPRGNFLGGHAVCICGYDDAYYGDGLRGAFLIMNSWGTSWGDNGFSWLPYSRVDAKVANSLPFLREAWASVDAEFVPKQAKRIILKPSNPTACVDGAYVQLDVPPIIQSGRTLVPIRFVTENMGYIVTWNKETQAIELRRPW